MKKIAKILLLSLVTISMTACDLNSILSSLPKGGDESSADADSTDSGNNYGDDDSSSSNDSSSNDSSSSDNGGESSSSSSSSQDEGPTWSAEYAAIMSAHLYGTVLPYTGDENTVVEYDEEYDMVTLTGGDVDLLDYETALLAQSYDVVGEAEDGSAFAVEKAVSTTSGDRFVYVYAEFDEEDGFYAEAYDPYVYSFPSDALAAFFDDYEATPFDVPAIDGADYYQFYEDDYNFLYLMFEMEDSINATLAGFGCTADDFTAYLGSLTAAGWEYEAQEYNGSTYYECELETDAGVAHMDAMYSSDLEAIGLTIYAYMTAADINPDTTYETWPASIVAQLLGSEVTDVLPPYAGDNNGFQILNDSYGTAVLVLVEDGTETAARDAYKETLKAANFTENGVDGYGDQIFLSPNEQFEVTPYFGTTGSMTIAFEAVKQAAAWPTDSVASAVGALATGITDVVPASEGAEEYYLYTADPTKVQIQCTYSTGLDAALTAYKATLATAGWTSAGNSASGSPYYNSPNEQLNVNPWKYTSNGYSLLVIDVFPGKFVPASAGWPSAKIAEFIGSEELANQIPAYDQSRVYEVEESNYADFIIYTASDDKAADVAAYTEILKAAGFTDNGKDSYGDQHYLSPNGRVDLNPTDGYNGIFVIEVNVVPVTYTSWPTAEVNALTAANGAENDTILPRDGGTKYEIIEDYDYSDMAVVVYCDSPADVNTAYCSALATAGWSYDGKVSGQETYTSPNGEITVSMWVRSYSGALNIEVTFND